MGNASSAPPHDGTLAAAVPLQFRVIPVEPHLFNFFYLSTDEAKDIESVVGESYSGLVSLIRADRVDARPAPLAFTGELAGRVLYPTVLGGMNGLASHLNGFALYSWPGMRRPFSLDPRKRKRVKDPHGLNTAIYKLFDPDERSREEKHEICRMYLDRLVTIMYQRETLGVPASISLMAGYTETDPENWVIHYGIAQDIGFDEEYARDVVYRCRDEGVYHVLLGYMANKRPAYTWSEIYTDVLQENQAVEDALDECRRDCAPLRARFRGDQLVINAPRDTFDWELATEGNQVTFTRRFTQRSLKRVMLELQSRTAAVPEGVGFATPVIDNDLLRFYVELTGEVTISTLHEYCEEGKMTTQDWTDLATYCVGLATRTRTFQSGTLLEDVVFFNGAMFIMLGLGQQDRSLVPYAPLYDEVRRVMSLAKPEPDHPLAYFAASNDPANLTEWIEFGNVIRNYRARTDLLRDACAEACP